MPSDGDGHIRVIGGDSCHSVAATLSGAALVFSIQSDDRLPAEVETILKSMADGDGLPSDIHIVGDLHGVPVEHWRLRAYMSKMLRSITGRHFRLFWYDGDLIRGGSGFHVKHPLCIDHIAPSSVMKDCPVNEPLTGLPDAVSEETLVAISSIIGSTPRASFNESGELSMLDFCVGDSYPRNIMSHLGDGHIGNVLKQVAGLSSLKVLRLGFLEGLQITGLPNGLQKLDCRGCVGVQIDGKVIPSTLGSLNLSACKLTRLPRFLIQLTGLRELLLYKNGIIECDQSGFPASLRRLSLYRNRISRLRLDLSRLQHLEALNMGANPLEYLHLENGTPVRNLTVNLRKVAIESLDFRVDCPYNISFS